MEKFEALAGPAGADLAGLGASRARVERMLEGGPGRPARAPAVCPGPGGPRSRLRLAARPGPGGPPAPALRAPPGPLRGDSDFHEGL